MRHPDPDRIRALIAAVAEEEILPRFRTLTTDQVRIKTHPGDLVTDADVCAERQLVRRLKDELPGSLAVGEEAVHADRTLLDRLSGDDPVWVIDPVDGTRNFAQGSPLFASIVALVVRGRTVQGWLHDPLRGVTVYAEEGGGTWRDGDRLRVRSGEGADLARLEGSPGHGPAGKILLPHIGKVHRHASAAHDYMALVEGRMHFAVFRHLMPWDHAAGVLAHLEAGGFAGLADGQTYSPRLSVGRLIAAPDRAAFDALRALLVDV